MDFSRRSFIGGAFSFGALAGCRAFRAPAGLFSGDGAKLVLGVVSDIHVDLRVTGGIEMRLRCGLEV